ncbi:MAG TPA: Asp-tRNA(Asn)/Glu-tRNA(Gln) amidotransferase subunit GatC [Candidatus Paceibacterota bacterium]
MLSIEELRKLAGLARIEMPDNELEELRGQLDEILGYVGEVSKADVSSVPEVSVPDLRNVFREDYGPHENGKYSEAIIKNFPSSSNGSLKVKKILEK